MTRLRPTGFADRKRKKSGRDQNTSLCIVYTRTIQQRVYKYTHERRLPDVGVFYGRERRWALRLADTEAKHPTVVPTVGGPLVPGRCLLLVGCFSPLFPMPLFFSSVKYFVLELSRYVLCLEGTTGSPGCITTRVCKYSYVRIFPPIERNTPCACLYSSNGTLLIQCDPYLYPTLPYLTLPCLALPYLTYLILYLILSYLISPTVLLQGRFQFHLQLSSSATCERGKT